MSDEYAFDTTNLRISNGVTNKTFVGYIFLKSGIGVESLKKLIVL